MIVYTSYLQFSESVLLPIREMTASQLCSQRSDDKKGRMEERIETTKIITRCTQYMLKRSSHPFVQGLSKSMNFSSQRALEVVVEQQSIHDAAEC